MCEYGVISQYVVLCEYGVTSQYVVLCEYSDVSMRYCVNTVMSVCGTV